MLQIKKLKNNDKYLTVNDRGKLIKIKQPTAIQLSPLYCVLLANMIKHNNLNH